MENWPTTLAIVSLALFSLGIIGVILAYLVPMSATKTRWLCNTGLLGFLVLSVNSLILYLWHHYWR
jgi:hypothetical protein